MAASNKIQVGYIEAQDGAQFEIDAGTAAAPGLVFDDSAATGLYSPGTGQIAWSTSGKQTALRILADGKVGIDCSPTVALEVNGTIKASAIEAPIEGTLDDWIVHAGDTNTKFGFPGNDQFEVYAGGGPKLKISSAGVVDINNAAGQSHYQITQSSGNTVKFGIVSGSNIELSGSSNNDFYIKLNGNNERLRIKADGKVAIGNTSPQQLLHVWPDAADTTSAYVRVTAGDRNSGTGLDIGHDASGNGHVNMVSNGTLTFSTLNTPRIKIANNSAATAIGTNAAYNAMLTVRGDISGALLMLKATEDTNRLMVSGTDSNGVEVNLYDDAGGQKGILGVSGTEFFIKAPNNSAPMTFYTHNGSSIGERLRINSAGTVRIKRAVSTSLGNDSIFLAIGDTENGTNVNRMIGFGYNSNFGTSVYPASMGYTETDNSGNTKGALTFNTRNTTGATDAPVERLRIDSSGRLLINAIATRASAGGNAMLQIEKNSSELASFLRTDNGNGAAWLALCKSRSAAGAVCQAGDNIGAIAFIPHDGTDLNHHAAEIRAYVDTGIGGNDTPGYLTFHTNAGSTTTTERLRIESDGDFRFSSDNASNNYGWIRGWHSATGDMTISADHSATGTGTSKSNLIFKSRGSEKMRMTSDGVLKFGGVIQSISASDSTSSNSITPANNDWITFASLPYAHSVCGELWINWTSIQAPACCYHGAANLRIGGNHFTYHYGWESTLELLSCQAHNSAWFRSWRLIRDGSILKLQGRWAGSTVQSGTFYTDITRGNTNPKTTANIDAITPVVENSLSGTVQAELDAQRDADSPPNGGGDFIQHGKYGIFHAHKGLSTKGTFWNYKQEQAALAGTNYTQTAGSYSKIIPDSELFDVGGDYASVSSGRYTCPYDGTYLFSWWGLLYPHSHTTGNVTMSVRLNGNGYGNAVQHGGVNSGHALGSGTQLVRASQGDNLELWLYTISGSGTKAYGSQWNMSVYFMG